MENELLTPNECAAYLRISTRHFSERIALLPSFPAPIRLPTLSGGRGNPLWNREEFLTWVEQQKVAA